MAPFARAVVRHYFQRRQLAIAIARVRLPASAAVKSCSQRHCACLLPEWRARKWCNRWRAREGGSQSSVDWTYRRGTALTTVAVVIKHVTSCYNRGINLAAQLVLCSAPFNPESESNPSQHKYASLIPQIYCKASTRHHEDLPQSAAIDGVQD
jgi:hypothetical protein